MHHTSSKMAQQELFLNFRKRPVCFPKCITRLIVYTGERNLRHPFINYFKKLRKKHFSHPKQPASRNIEILRNVLFVWRNTKLVSFDNLEKRKQKKLETQPQFATQHDCQQTCVLCTLGWVITFLQLNIDNCQMGFCHKLIRRQTGKEQSSFLSLWFM